MLVDTKDIYDMLMAEARKVYAFGVNNPWADREAKTLRRAAQMVKDMEEHDAKTN